MHTMIGEILRKPKENYTGVDPKHRSTWPSHRTIEAPGADHHLGRGGITVNSDTLVTLKAPITTWAEAGSL